MNRLDQTVLTTLTNPGILELKKAHPHLKGIHFDNKDDRPSHLIHLILGTGDQDSTPVSEEMVAQLSPWLKELRLGGHSWNKGGRTQAISTLPEHLKTTINSSLACLQDGPIDDPDGILTEFNEQLTRLPDGRYSTRLPWKLRHPPLLTNEIPSKARLEGLIKNLERKPEIMLQYHNIIADQMKQGIIEQAPEPPTGEKKFYLPHKPAINHGRNGWRLSLKK